jgi:hypothetical protein
MAAAAAAASEIIILAMVQYLWYPSAINIIIITGLGWLQWCLITNGQNDIFRIVLAMEKDDWRPFIMLQTNG